MAISVVIMTERQHFVATKFISLKEAVTPLKMKNGFSAERQVYEHP